MDRQISEASRTWPVHSQLKQPTELALKHKPAEVMARAAPHRAPAPEPPAPAAHAYTPPRPANGAHPCTLPNDFVLLPRSVAKGKENETKHTG